MDSRKAFNSSFCEAMADLDELLIKARVLDNNVLQDIQAEYAIEEFLDYYRVLGYEAEKHGSLNFLDPNGSKSSKKEMYASMFRHLAQASMGEEYDEDTAQHPLLHLIARAQMLYTRHKRGIVHEDDK